MRNILHEKKTPLAGRFFFDPVFSLGFILLFASWMNTIHFPPWTSWHNEIFAFASTLLLALAIVCSSWKRGAGMIAIPVVAVPFLALMGLALAQALMGRIVFAGDVVVITFYLALYVLASVVGYTVAQQGANHSGRSFSAIQQLAVVLVLGGVCSVTAALAQAFDLWGLGTWIVPLQQLRRPGGNIAQANQLATLILFSMCSVLYLFEAKRLSALSATCIAILLVLGLAITESRGGVLSFVLLAAWWWAMNKRIGFTLSRRSFVVWVLFFCLSYWSWPSFFNLVHEGGGSGLFAARLNATGGTRFVVWAQLFHAALEHPWFGWGLREVSTAHNAVALMYPGDMAEAFTYAHNVVLDLLVGIGFPLTLVLVVLVTRWMWRRACAVDSVLAWYCLAIAIPFVVHSMLEFPFAYAYLILPVMLCLGVLEGRLSSDSSLRVPSWLAAAILGLLSGMMVWSAIEYVEVEEDYRIVRFESLQLGQTPSAYDRPHIVLLTQLGALLEAGRIVPAPQMQPETIELARKVALRFPWPATQNRYALALALNGNAEEAVRQLRVIKALHGAKEYARVRANWSELGNTKYPQLKAVAIP